MDVCFGAGPADQCCHAGILGDLHAWWNTRRSGSSCLAGLFPGFTAHGGVWKFGNCSPITRGSAITAAGTRRHLDQDYDLYYNPMWSYLGDLSPGPPGTIYDRSGRGPYGWSMLDQVILSHSVVDLFGGVQILTTAGTSSLLDANGRPDSQNASDHLPVMLKLRGESRV